MGAISRFADCGPADEAFFGAWIQRIAVDLVSRRPVRQLVFPSDGDLSLDDGPGESSWRLPPTEWSDLTDALTERLELIDRVRYVLERCGALERAAFVLHEIEGLPAEQVAGILRMSSRSVRLASHSVLVRLRGRLDQLLRVARTETGTE